MEVKAWQGDEKGEEGERRSKAVNGGREKGAERSRLRVWTGPGPYDFFISSGRISAPNERVKGVRSTK